MLFVVAILSFFGVNVSSQGMGYFNFQPYQHNQVEAIDSDDLRESPPIKQIVKEDPKVMEDHINYQIIASPVIIEDIVQEKLIDIEDVKEKSIINIIDSDGDGYSDEEEIANGFDPYVDESKLAKPKVQTVAIPQEIQPVVIQQEAIVNVIKMSKSGICHAPGSTYYSRTKNFISYDSVDKCLQAGGRLPLR